TVCSGEVAPFQCYRSSVITAQPPTTEVTLADSFSTTGTTLHVELDAPRGVCFGATVDGTPQTASLSRGLQRYKLSVRQRASRLVLARLSGRSLQATDQFGSMQLRLRRLRHLMIASGAETTILPSAPSAPENFACYSFRPSAPTVTRRVTEVDRYGTV